jgi:hypothetical protein
MIESSDNRPIFSSNHPTSKNRNRNRRILAPFWIPHEPERRPPARRVSNRPPTTGSETGAPLLDENIS